MGKSKKSSDGGSSGGKSKSKSKKELVAPFDRPTILCWLMQRTKYEDAMERLHDAPEEASTWLVDENGSKRVLPLHVACRQLKEEENQRQRIALCDLISHLLLVHPKAAEQHDAPDGRLAIQDAVAGGIDEETLALLLTVYPESIDEVDERKLTLTEINRLNTNDPDIQSVIDLGYDEWKMAYDASPLASGVSLSRMDDLVSVASAASKGTAATGPRFSDDDEDDVDRDIGDEKFPGLGRQDSYGDDDSTISSLESEADDTHVDTAGGMATAEVDEESEDEEIPIVKWERVEERALALEKILADMKEENFSLHEKIQLLSNDQGLKIILQVDRNQGTDLYSMVDMLQHQNFALDQNIYKTETLLHYSVFPSDDESVGRQRRRGEVAQMLGWLDGDEDTNPGETLQQIHDELKASYDQQKAAIEQFGFVFEIIGDKLPDGEENESSHAQRSVVSNLTMNDDDWSLNSHDDPDDASRPSKSSGVQIEIEWPEEQVNACEVSDNLSTIFRHASGMVEEEDDDMQGDSAMDNLSQILQTAAAKDKRRKKVDEVNKKSKKKSTSRKTKDRSESSDNDNELALPALGDEPPPESVQMSKADSQYSKPSFYDASVGARPGVKKATSKRSMGSTPSRRKGDQNSVHTNSSDGSRGLFRDKTRNNAVKKKRENPLRPVGGEHDPMVNSAEFDYYAEYKELPASPKEPTQVSFGAVSVRVYDRIIGDNPGCSNGPSLGIGWIFVPQDDCSVDAFEGWRDSERDASSLLMTREERETLLRSLGYTNKEIASNVREINRIRSQRRQTIVNLGAAKMQERVESARRMVKSALTLGRSKKLTDSLSSSSTHSTSSLTKDKSEGGGSNASPHSSSIKSAVKPPIKTIDPLVQERHRGSIGGISKSGSQHSKRSF